jgi:hypothetical protein
MLNILLSLYNCSQIVKTSSFTQTPKVTLAVYLITLLILVDDTIYYLFFLLWNVFSLPCGAGALSFWLIVC